MQSENCLSPFCLLASQYFEAAVGQRLARRAARFGHRLVLDQNALELERTDAVVGRLEDIIRAADVRVKAPFSSSTAVSPSLVELARNRFDAALPSVALHQTDWTLSSEVDGDLTVPTALTTAAPMAARIGRRSG
jgi:hypothetical protein